MQKTKPKNEPIKIEEQAYVVTIVPVIPTALSPTLTLYGRVESHRWPTLRTPTLSLSANVEVIKVAVLEGDLKSDVMPTISLPSPMKKRCFH